MSGISSKIAVAALCKVSLKSGVRCGSTDRKLAQEQAKAYRSAETRGHVSQPWVSIHRIILEMETFSCVFCALCGRRGAARLLAWWW
jgi:hypothetical protein